MRAADRAVDGKLLRRDCLEQGVSRACLGRESLPVLAETLPLRVSISLPVAGHTRGGLCEELRA